MTIPPISPMPQFRDQVILKYLTAATESTDAALKVLEGNPATGSPGMSEQAKDQNYALVRAAAIDAALNTPEIIGKMNFVRQGSIQFPDGVIRSGAASQTFSKGSVPMRITAVRRGCLVLRPISTQFELDADAVEGLI